MTSSDLSAKPVTRRTVLARRDALSPFAREIASMRIAERVNDLLSNAKSRTVALYAPKGSEVETWLIDEHVRATGGRVVYPRVVDHTRELEFRRVEYDTGATIAHLRETYGDREWAPTILRRLETQRA